jgi:hypothetical protein
LLVVCVAVVAVAVVAVVFVALVGVGVVVLVLAVVVVAAFVVVVLLVTALLVLVVLLPAWLVLLPSVRRPGSFVHENDRLRPLSPTLACPSLHAHTTIAPHSSSTVKQQKQKTQI